MKTKHVIILMLSIIFLSMHVIAAEKLTETLIKNWDGFDWVYQGKNIYEYPADNQQIMIYYDYNHTENDWMAVQKTTTTIDSKGNPTEIIMDLHVSGDWQNLTTMVMTNTYDGDKLQKVETTFSTFITTLSTYIYEDGKLKEVLNQMNLGSDWVDTDRMRYYYQGNDLDYTTIEEYFEAAWHFLIKTQYHYANNRKDNIETYEWNETDWEKSLIRYYHYNNDGTVSIEHELYWDGSVYEDGEKSYHTYGSTPVARNNEALIKTFTLKNYPNPFNPETNIQFNLKENATIALEIFDLQGRKINTLIARENKQAGTYTVKWNGMNSKGESMSSGVYIYRLISDRTIVSKQCILLK